jgi:hypothetical protein
MWFHWNRLKWTELYKPRGSKGISRLAIAQPLIHLVVSPAIVIILIWAIKKPVRTISNFVFSLNALQQRNRVFPAEIDGLLQSLIVIHA